MDEGGGNVHKPTDVAVVLEWVRSLTRAVLGLAVCVCVCARACVCVSDVC